MPALLTFYPKDAPSVTALLREGESPVAGRDPDNKIAIGDSRVSARHARFQWRGTGWALVDLGSKNGTFANGVRVTEKDIESGDWISLGGLPAQFIVVTEEGLSSFLADRASRRRTSSEIRVALEKDTDAPALLKRLVESALNVAGAERGFVLVRSLGGPLRADANGGAPFPASRDAVERTLSTARPVVAGPARQTPDDGTMNGGPFVCVPLRDRSRVIGVLYLDGKRSGASFSDLDVETLETLADRAASVLASPRLNLEVREMTDGAFVGET